MSKAKLRASLPYAGYTFHLAASGMCSQYIVHYNGISREKQLFLEILISKVQNGGTHYQSPPAPSVCG